MVGRVRESGRSLSYGAHGTGRFSFVYRVARRNAAREIRFVSGRKVKNKPARRAARHKSGNPRWKSDSHPKNRDTSLARRRVRSSRRIRFFLSFFFSSSSSSSFFFNEHKPNFCTVLNGILFVLILIQPRTRFGSSNFLFKITNIIELLEYLSSCI